jgi:hypothetical protein
MPVNSDNRLKCSFCGKTQDLVKKLIAGPGVYVCNECVDLCNEILADEGFAPERISVRQLQGDGPSQEERPHPLESVPEGVLNTAMKSIEALIEAYEGGLRTATAEPFYRALLAMQEHQFGSLDNRLLPILEKLYQIYDNKGQPASCLHALEWIISIGDATTNTEKPPNRTWQLLKLVQIHISLNQHRQAQEVLKQLLMEH